MSELISTAVRHLNIPAIENRIPDSWETSHRKNLSNQHAELIAQYVELTECRMLLQSNVRHSSEVVYQVLWCPSMPTMECYQAKLISNSIIDLIWFDFNHKTYFGWTCWNTLRTWAAGLSTVYNLLVCCDVWLNSEKSIAVVSLTRLECMLKCHWWFDICGCKLRDIFLVAYAIFKENKFIEDFLGFLNVAKMFKFSPAFWGYSSIFCYFLLLVWFCLFLCVEERMKNGVQGRGCVGKRGKSRESSGASKREVRRSTVGCC